ncbi:hypothetical protein GCM10017783_05500 [Deinococcus piscis]|uniref:MarR family transcriptional regulator n=1 Tax=Deinococcus piscis TaxID=394230 RepID=A0ABQ3K1J8_9DEIO|nr:hypothetical protein [Deinococcus piscis]GHF96526.1 hypothetical protein GCM10017783_05500 [Deinococcus piscis]
MTPLRTLTAIIFGFAFSLITFAAFYVRGDLGSVFRYLGARGDARRLEAAGGTLEQLAAAQAQVHALADAAADPDFAVRMLPLCLLLGVLTGYAVWRLFGSRAGRAEATDVQERMLLRLAYRRGGRFSLEDVAASSPLTEVQAVQVVQRMKEAGRLRDAGSGLYELV